MASLVPPTVPMGDEAPGGAALQHRPWRNRANLSSGLTKVEEFLESAGFDRAPWLVVAFAAGIAGWFVLHSRWQWLAWIAAGLAVSLGSLAVSPRTGDFPICANRLPR